MSLLIVHDTGGPLKVKIDSVSQLNTQVLRTIMGYIDLLETLRVVPTPGLREIYGYRSGTTYFDLPINEDYIASREGQRQLTIFANVCISYNIMTFVHLIRCAMLRDFEERCSSPDGDVHRQAFLTAEALHMLDRFSDDMTRMENRDYAEVMNVLSQTIMHVAAAPIRKGILSVTSVSRFFALVEEDIHNGEDYRIYHLPLLKIMFALACAYYNIQPGELRATPTPIRYTSSLRINDTSLACAPPSWSIIEACADRETPSSTEAVVYLENLRLCMLEVGLLIDGIERTND